MPQQISAGKKSGILIRSICVYDRVETCVINHVETFKRGDKAVYTNVVACRMVLAYLLKLE